jgi:hypothetical protein
MRRITDDVRWIAVRHMMEGYSTFQSADMLYLSSRSIERIKSTFRKWGDVKDPFASPDLKPSKVNQDAVDVSVFPSHPSVPEGRSAC